MTITETDRRLAVRARREAREHERAMAALNEARRLRDDAISRIRNSGMSYEQVEAAGGPCVRTLLSWEEGRVSSPRLTSIALVARVLKLRLGFTK